MDAMLVDPAITIGLSIALFASLSASLILAGITIRQAKASLMAVAAVVLVIATVIAAVSPFGIHPYSAVPIALLGVGVAVLGGNPATRVVLRLAAGNRVRETADGGILIAPPRQSGTAEETNALLRGGTAIGYLERLAVVLAVMAGLPEAIAVIVAIKGIGRFSELAAPEARERFIVGTFASLVWAAAAGALVRLSIW
jgi:hypothetical protein